MHSCDAVQPIPVVWYHRRCMVAAGAERTQHTASATAQHWPSSAGFLALCVASSGCSANQTSSNWAVDPGSAAQLLRTFFLCSRVFGADTNGAAGSIGARHPRRRSSYCFTGFPHCLHLHLSLPPFRCISATWAIARQHTNGQALLRTCCCGGCGGCMRAAAGGPQRCAHRCCWPRAVPVQ